MTSPPAAAPTPVTVMVTRRVKPEARPAFEAALAELCGAAVQFPGHLGVNVFRPSTPQDREYRIVFKFDDPARLDVWLADDATQALLDRVRRLTEGEAEVTRLVGLEAWFTLPGAAGPAPPRRPRMALVNWLALWPLVSALLAALGPLLEPFPFLVRTAAVTGLVVLLMTWVIMPRLSKWCAPWLSGATKLPSA